MPKMQPKFKYNYATNTIYFDIYAIHGLPNPQFLKKGTAKNTSQNNEHRMGLTLHESQLLIRNK